MELFILKFGAIPLWIFFALPAFLYVALIHKLPFKGDFVIKALPVLFLAVLSWIYIPGTAGKLLFVGFLLSAGGDISLSFKGEKFFLGGLGFFLSAHILYMIAFAQNSQYESSQLPILIALGVFAVGMAIVLSPKLGEMRIPVFVYVSVILGMGVFATLWQGENHLLLLIGAIIFMLSDSMIAIDRFLKPISWSKYFIMLTYYIGQFMICSSFLPQPV